MNAGINTFSEFKKISRKYLLEDGVHDLAKAEIEEDIETLVGMITEMGVILDQIVKLMHFCPTSDARYLLIEGVRHILKGLNNEG